MLAVMPALAVAGLAFGTLAGRLTTQAGDAYGTANSIVQQVSPQSHFDMHRRMHVAGRHTYTGIDQSPGVCWR